MFQLPRLLEYLLFRVPCSICRASRTSPKHISPSDCCVYLEHEQDIRIESFATSPTIALP
ncbi:hypothetical protein BC936DRAFT_143663 [Jimgerdemannia flammicorona]|uniref:Uncharacterized protein n=1 Tax=Jimgerdemannia flammicorona TaxID=994334 RepID=A0A433DDI5_9FUNG|nr:hypothetical protein BC936DRAFT_143663 [Jimgerdemannia flammicorona]